MIRKYVNEVLKRYNLSPEEYSDVLIEFVSELWEDGKILTQDIDDSVKRIMEDVIGMKPEVPRLDADTKEIVVAVIKSGHCPSRPILIKFEGESALVDLEVEVIPQVAVVTRLNGELQVGLKSKIIS